MKGWTGEQGSEQRRRRRRVGAIGVLSLALIAASCGSGGSNTGASSGGGASSSTSAANSGNSGNSGVATAQPLRAAKGGTVTAGLIEGIQPNWIWPFTPIQYYSIYNSQGFQWLMYRPLYMFGNNGSSVQINYPLSPANAPAYSNGGKTVTISMKGWKWSDGETVDAADVAFWLNMVKWEKANYAGYSPGTLPDNIASYSIPSRDKIVLHLTKAYAGLWFTYNQLAEITPMPAAWDVTKSGAKAGSGGCASKRAWNNKAACTAVFNFLNSQAKDTSSYAHSPIWGVVDGPWRLSTFTTGGNDSFVPNRSYSGSPKPKIAVYKLVTYTSDATMYTALRAGTLDIGPIPPSDLPLKSNPKQILPSRNPLGSGYSLSPAFEYGIFYEQLNWKNPTYGPLFKQLYFRQALQEVIDQPGIDRAIWRGYAYPDSGPVPPKPASAFIPKVQMEHGGQGPYPYNPSAAKKLLEKHGWAMRGGVMTCVTPSRCGAGVKAGTKATLTLDWATGQAAVQAQTEDMKSSASLAGIQLNLNGETFNAIIGTDTNHNKSWQMDGAGGWLYNGPGFLPTGEPLFQTGALSNNGSYSNAKMDRLIREVQVNSSLSVFHQYATYNAEQLPYLWTPNAYGIEAVKRSVHDVGFNPLGTVLPEYYYFSK